MSHLYLLRHADAEHETANDFDRVLSEKGARQCHKIAAFLSAHNLRPQVVLCSPVIRAKQTAERVCLEAQLPMPIMESFLACGMHPDTAFEELLRYSTKHDEIMIVGHEPDFSDFAAAALGLHDSDSINVRKGSVLGLSYHTKLAPGSATLEFHVPVKLMKG